MDSSGATADFPKGAWPLSCNRPMRSLLFCIKKGLGHRHNMETQLFWETTDQIITHFKNDGTEYRARWLINGILLSNFSYFCILKTSKGSRLLHGNWSMSLFSALIALFFKFKTCQVPFHPRQLLKLLHDFREKGNIGKLSWILRRYGIIAICFSPSNCVKACKAGPKWAKNGSK